MNPLKSTPIWDDPGGGEGREIAGIADIARGSRNKERTLRGRKDTGLLA